MNLIIKDLDMDNEIVLLQLTGALAKYGHHFDGLFLCQKH